MNRNLLQSLYQKLDLLRKKNEKEEVVKREISIEDLKKAINAYPDKNLKPNNGKKATNMAEIAECVSKANNDSYIYYLAKDTEEEERIDNTIVASSSVISRLNTLEMLTKNCSVEVIERLKNKIDDYYLLARILVFGANATSPKLVLMASNTAIYEVLESTDLTVQQKVKYLGYIYGVKPSKLPIGELNSIINTIKSDKDEEIVRKRVK